MTSEPVRLRSEAKLAALVAALTAAAVLWNALRLAGTHTYGAWDWLAQACSLTRVEPPPAIEHLEILDPVRQAVPWAAAAREQLAQGRAPLWSEYNGGGPLLGNFQSALLSPFTWPFFALPVGAATLVSAWLKLFALAFGMFLFLRELTLSRLASAVGAAAYGSAGFSIMCVLHPHVGVLAWLPPCLAAIERASRRFRESPERVPFGPLAALALLLGAMTLAGHPETLLFCLYAVVAFALLRTAQAGRGAFRFGLGLLVAGVAGGLIGAVQTAPFLELFSESALAHGEGRRLAPFPLWHALLLLFPDAPGNPSDGGLAGAMLAANWQEVNSMHVAAPVALLALLAPLALGRCATGWSFWALGLAAFAAPLDVPLLTEVNDVLFAASRMPATRANALWLVAACVCAGLVIDRAFSPGSSPSTKRSVLVLAGAFTLLAAARASLPTIWQRFGESPSLAAIAATAAQRSNVAAAIAIAALAALAWLRWSSSSTPRRLASALLVASVLGHGVYVFGDFMPVVEDRCVLPRSTALEELQRATEGERAAFLTNDSLPVNSNALYGVALASSYEVLEERRWTRLREEQLGVTSHMSGTRFASRRALDLFGIRWVLTRGAWLPVDTENCFGGIETQSCWPLMVELGMPRQPRTAALDAERPKLSQRFRASRDHLRALALVLTAGEEKARFALELSEGATVHARREFRVSELREMDSGRRECVFAFEPLAGSAARAFVLSAELIEPAAGTRLEFVRPGKLSAALSGGDEPDEGGSANGGRARVLFDAAYGDRGFEAPRAVGELLLHRYSAGRGKCWLVPQAITARDEEHAYELVNALDFDPRAVVVLEEASTKPDDSASVASLELQLELSQPGELRARTHASEPAHLVLSQPRLPGWRARIDGEDAEVLRANYAFCAVAVPAGEHTVEFEYAPATFRHGAWASVIATLAALAVLAGAARARR